MTEALPLVYLARHGETAWSLSGQHTGRTDLPLTGRGEDQARALGERLRGLEFAKVLTSPSQRAVRTCALAGFGAAADTDPDLAEWDYGDYEGRRTAEILTERPDWQLFRDGAPGGEMPEQVAARADRCHRPHPRGSWQCAGRLERAYIACSRRPLARTAAVGRALFFPRHGEPQPVGLRARHDRADNPAVERPESRHDLMPVRMPSGL